MNPAVAATARSTPIVFQDGLGERRHITDPTGSNTFEMLCLNHELTAVPSFEFALRERVGRLASFRHPYYAHVRSVDRVNDGATLAIVSEPVFGVRLSNALVVAEQHHVPLDINAALCLVRQLVPAVGMLHEHGRDIVHGALAPERIAITPRARLVILEYVMGAALEQVRFSHQRYWKDLRIALPRSAGLPRFDERVDVTQIGLVALSLILGRPLREEEYPARIQELVASAWAISGRGDLEPLPAGLRMWLIRALQIDLRRAFRSVAEAGAELENVLAADGDLAAEPATLETFLARCQACVQPDAPLVDRPVRLQPGPIAAAPRIPENATPVAKTEAVHVERRVPSVESAVPAQLDACSTPPAGPPEAVPVSSLQSPVSSPQSPVSRPQSPVEGRQSSVLARAERPLSDMAAALASVHLTEEPVCLQSTPEAVVLETIGERSEDEQTGTQSRSLKVVAAVLGFVALAGVGLFAARHFGMATAATGMVVVNTNPAGALASVDGVARGLTPVTLRLSAGEHVLELRGSGDPRRIPIAVAGGTQVSQYIELPLGGSSTGQLQVRTDPPGAAIGIDAIARGVSPITIADLAPGQHTVMLTSDAGSVTQAVTIQPGVTASLVVPLKARASVPVSGWIAVSAPVEVQLYEDGKLLGSSQADRIMLAAGSHQIEIVNETLAYRATRTIQVAAGKVVPLAVKLPMGSMALNATPWAEVWIDGEKVGETPIANVPVSIGPHEIIFRNPDLGELRHAATVTLDAPARVSVDLRKK